MKGPPSTNTARNSHLPLGLSCFGLWLVMIVTALWLRPLTPRTETRYAAVAWESWANGSFLVPLLNGEPYSHKPPLLFWLTHAGWSILGVNETWLRVVPPLFGLASIYVVFRIGKILWPNVAAAATLATTTFFGSALFFTFGTLTMYDMPVVLFTLLGLYSILGALHHGTVRTLIIGSGVAMGFGILSKGPVILIFVLPVALSAPWWFDGKACVRWTQWYTGLVGAVVLAFGIALVWALPAAYSGGVTYAQEILWTQTSGRLADSFAHKRPFWWYLPLLPAILFPWVAWPRLWRTGFNRQIWRESGIRFCIAWLLPGFLLLSLISGKQVHYLAPLMPALSLILGRLAADSRTEVGHTETLYTGFVFFVLGLVSVIGMAGLVPANWTGGVLDSLNRAHGESWSMTIPGMVLAISGAIVAFSRFGSSMAVARAHAVLMGVMFVVGNIYFAHLMVGAYDVRPASKYLADLQRSGHPLSQFEVYHGQYHFYGRLVEPIFVVERHLLNEWLNRNPDGRVLAYPRHLPASDSGPEFSTRYRGRYLTIWTGEQLAANADMFDLDIVARIDQI